MASKRTQQSSSSSLARLFHPVARWGRVIGISSQNIPKEPSFGDFSNRWFGNHRLFLSGLGEHRVMRRKEKEITHIEDIEEIISSAVVCRLAMVDGDQPYIVPLCFGYENRTLYFHTGIKGKKIDVLEKNPNVCFEFDAGCKVLKQPDACDWGMAYRSVIGYGKASFVTSPESKRKALDVIMRQYKGSSGPYPDVKIKVTRIIRVEIEQMTGKRSPI